jgi:RimJ/RimL family protein N-acetyltransferase
MFERLLPDQYYRLTPLIAPFGTQHLIVQALLEGTCPGTIYVNNVTTLQSAFIASAEGRFLLGSPTNSDFNSALRHHFERLFAGEREAWEEELVLTCYPDTWADALRNEILPFRPPFVSQRYYYRFEASKVEWRSQLPPEIELHPISGEVLARANLSNHKDILFWVNKNYGSQAHFLAQGCGICLIHDHKIVSWSLTDCTWGDACEIGIETDEAYRRRGLATIVTAAMVEECQARGWTHIGWHCWHHNLGSIGVAEAVGFRHQATYNSYVSLYDPLMHLAVQGYAALRNEDFATAADWYAQVSNVENAPEWAFYQLARCQAMLNQPQAAFSSLRGAIEKGWKDEDFLRNHPHFTPLQDYPEWHEIGSLLNK